MNLFIFQTPLYLTKSKSCFSQYVFTEILGPPPLYRCPKFTHLLNPLQKLTLKSYFYNQIFSKFASLSSLYSVLDLH